MSEQETVKASQPDMLLVRDMEKNTISAVKEVSKKGKLLTVPAEHKNQNQFMKVKVFRIESACPVGTGKLYHKYFSNEIDQLKQEYKGHIYNTDFYRYYRLGRTDWDHHFFQLGKIDLHNGVNSFVFEIDPHFSTYYDYKAARIISSELLYNYLLSRLEPDEPENIFLPEGNSRDFFWTDSKNALIELIYALHASGSISNGKLGIRKISSVLQLLFRVQLGDVHHAFHRMKDRRESRTLFLDQLKASLDQHMEKEL